MTQKTAPGAKDGRAPEDRARIGDATGKWRLRAYQAWAIVGACAVAGIFLYVCGVLWQAVATVVLTAFIVLVLHRLVALLQKKGVPRVAGVLLAYVAIIVVLAGVLVSLAPAIAQQASAFASSLPGYIQQAQDFLSTCLPQLAGTLGIDESQTDFGQRIRELATKAGGMVAEQAPQILQGAAGGIMDTAVGVGNALLILFVSFICAAWILIDLPKLSRELRPLFGEDARRRMGIVVSAFGTAVYGWMKSTLICAVITGVASALSFWALGIPYSALLGLICAVLYLVPYVGPAVAGFIVAVVALIASPLACVLSIVANGVIGFVVGNIVSPRLMQSSVNVHPAITLVAILVGGALGGAVGMLLSIPIAAALQGIFVTFYEARTGKRLGTPDGALFRTPEQAKMPHLHGHPHGADGMRAGGAAHAGAGEGSGGDARGQAGAAVETDAADAARAKADGMAETGAGDAVDADAADAADAESSRRGRDGETA